MTVRSDTGSIISSHMVPRKDQRSEAQKAWRADLSKESRRGREAVPTMAAISAPAKKRGRPIHIVD